MKRLLMLLLIIVANLMLAQAQFVIKGKVINKKTKQAITSATVYISNTSIVTASKNNGNYSLLVKNKAVYQLVASCIGYQTFTEQVLVNENATTIVNIELEEKTDNLNEVTVINEFEGFKKWGDLFIELFIGNSRFSDGCKILNPEAIRFKHFKDDNTLMAYAKEPIRIRNTALGYLIVFDLIKFEHNLSSTYLYYSGYPYFTELKQTASYKVIKNRKQAYEGSLMHFFRSCYNNNIAEQGFLVRRLDREENINKKLAKEELKLALNKEEAKVAIAANTKKYGKDVFNQPSYFNIIYNYELPLDSFSVKKNNHSLELKFKNHICVSYVHQKNWIDFTQNKPMPRVFDDIKDNIVISVLSLTNDKSLQIFADGTCNEPSNFIVEEYWGWSERMARLLPFDYQYQP